MAIGLSIALAVAGCGRLEYDQSGLDASWIDAAASDAAIDGASVDAGDGGMPDPCAWAAPILVPSLSTRNGEFQPTLSSDRRRLCFTSDRGGGSDPDIYCAERATADGPLGLARLQAALQSTGTDRMPALSPDHLELFFSSDRPGGAGGEDIYVSAWDDAAGEYAAPTLVLELATADSEAGPSLSEDGLELYFHRQPAGGRIAILRAHRDAIGGAFTVIGPVASIAGASGNDLEPTIGAGGRVLVFCTNRDTPGTPAGTFSLWCATGPGGHVWGTPRPVSVPGLEGAGACSPELASDGALYFNAPDFPGGLGGSDIFRSAR